MNAIPLARFIRVVPFLLVLGGCATDPEQTASRTIADDTALSCTLPTNCVTSVGSDEFPPLRYAGPATVGMAKLNATLAGFPEAKVVARSETAIEAIFTTPAGFQDQVSFRIDAAAQRIDYRSRSSFGLFDFGKNRSRMRELAKQFESRTAP